MALMMSISAFPEEGDIFSWKGTITGSKDTVFEGTEQNTSYPFCFQTITRSKRLRSSSKQAVSTLTLINLATSAWTFFRTNGLLPKM